MASPRQSSSETAFAFRYRQAAASLRSDLKPQSKNTQNILPLVFELKSLLAKNVPAPTRATVPAVPLLKASRGLYPFIERAFADAGYAANCVAEATLIAVEIVRKQAGQGGFAVQPRRWVIERTFAWLGRNRRLARDFEATIASATAFLYAASALLLTRRLAHAAGRG